VITVERDPSQVTKSGRPKVVYRAVCSTHGAVSRWAVGRWWGQAKLEEHEAASPGCARNAVEVPGVEPGSAEWLRYMTGSKIAAVMGLSSYESEFSLFLRMQGAIPAQQVTDLMQRGHYLEPAIRSWFSDQHPGWGMTQTGMWVSAARPLHAVSPDGLVTTSDGEVRLFEAKSAIQDDQWGEPGSDEIPVGYRCQVMWGMDVLGLKVAHVAVLTRQLAFAEYVVNYDEADAALLRERADAFLAALERDERPSIDGHDATYEAVKALHPDIDGGDIPVPDELAEAFCRARHAKKAAEAEAKRTTSLLADHMGAAQRATFAGRTIASRLSKGGGTPYLTAAQNLPTFDVLEEIAS
jgi:putative phage-type endonuclease